ncbi:peptide chain release factor 1 [Candidatus Saccharibacteria bacterium]|nr:peptide chain release factor 1 [Candidatus Saccharibacteria bacterium]
MQIDYQAIEDAWSSDLAKLEQDLQVTTDYNSDQYINNLRRQKKLATKLQTIQDYNQLGKDLEELKKLLDDPDFADLAKEEQAEKSKLRVELKQKLELMILPENPDDDKSVILELRAGAGGDEASLFASELLRGYGRWLEAKGLNVELLSSSENPVGGYKEVVCEIKSSRELGAYNLLKYESGVHRVQRVPTTESGGRIHTSTITVAVLPEVEESELDIDPNDLRIDTYRSSGHGGQSVNTTDSAVRITHLPSGVVVTCQDEKSQLKNKVKAMTILRSRLQAIWQAEQQAKLDQDRLVQVGTGDRSEKIRTYNYPQDRITDHRINQSWHGLEQIINGDFDKLWQTLDSNYHQQRLAQLLKSKPETT